MPQSVQLTRRQLQVATVAGATHEPRDSDSTELGPEALVGGGELRLDERGKPVPGSAGHGDLVVDLRLLDRELLASKSQLLCEGGHVLLHRDELLVEGLELRHDVELLILDVPTLAGERGGLLPHRLLVSVRASPSRAQALLDRRNPGAYRLRTVVESKLPCRELVVLFLGVRHLVGLLREPRGEVGYRGTRSGACGGGTPGGQA